VNAQSLRSADASVENDEAAHYNLECLRVRQIPGTPRDDTNAELGGREQITKQKADGVMIIPTDRGIAVGAKTRTAAAATVAIA
jgi:hypothetical protein